MAEAFVTHIIIAIAKIFLFCFQMAMLKVELALRLEKDGTVWNGGTVDEAYMRTQIKMEAANRTR